MAAVGAWANGYFCGVYLERRALREASSWPIFALVDLTEPTPPYDWAVDGEAIQVAS